MKRLLSLWALTLLAQSAFCFQGPAVHLKYDRAVNATAAGQNYLILDPDVMAHSRRDLGDPRLFDANAQEHPYALQIDEPSLSTEEAPAQVLNKGMQNGRLVFLLSTGIEEYDRITLKTGRKDFVVQAQVEGADRSAGPWTKLGSYPLYDFSREELGRNESIRLTTPVRFRLLRLSVPGLKSEDITAASISFLPKREPQYVHLPYSPSFEQKDKKTFLRWDQPEDVPVDRIAIDLPASEVNFRRPMTVYCVQEKIKETVAQGDLSRIHLVRHGRLIESENLKLVTRGAYCARYLAEIDNGDNPPLHITAVFPEMRQRRIYFELAAPEELKLYYGDEKLALPVYDYAKLFNAEPEKAKEASLGPEMENPDYQPRPDDRPWSERHPAVLWTVMIVAVLALAAVALRGIRT